MPIQKMNQVNLLPFKFFVFICLSSFTNAQAQEVFQEKTSAINTSYLEPKEDLKSYILDTGDIINIRFKNRPGGSLKQSIRQKTNKREISYLEPINSIKDYILDTGDSIYLDFNIDGSSGDPYSGNYTINNDGEVYLPEIKNSYVRGLTVSELKVLLDKRYDEYLISPDIEIRIKNFKFIPNGKFSVNAEGEILLPQIPNDPDEITRKTYVRGLTPSELEKLLEKRYSSYFMNPDVFIDISTYKPLRISIRGEVRSPGIVKFPAYQNITNKNILQTIKSTNSESLLGKDSLNFNYNNRQEISSQLNNQSSPSNNQSENSSSILTSNKIKRDTQFVTTLSDVIQKAGGLTSYSNISKIEVVRDVSLLQGGGKKRAIINFLPYINKGDDTNDIRVFDGDSILIPSLQEKNPTIVPNSIIAGLSPKFIEVTITGRIENPGMLKLPLEGSMSDAIDLKGPRKPLSGKVYLIRYNKDGTLLRKKINYSSTAAPGSSKNPTLIDGDFITIRNSLIGRSSGILKDLTAPFVGVYASKEVYNQLTGN